MIVQFPLKIAFMPPRLLIDHPSHCLYRLLPVASTTYFKQELHILNIIYRKETAK